MNTKRIIQLYALLVACAMLSGCKDEPEGVMWSRFAGAVVKAGKAGDFNALVDRLTIYKVANGKKLMDEVMKANPDLTYMEGADNPTDEIGRRVMLEDVKLFVQSYDDLFDGKIACVASAQDTEIKGPELYSAIIWVERGGRFYGIKVDSIWKRGNTLRVVEWVRLSGYYAGRNVVKKRAVLERETIDSCDYPLTIEYEIEIVN